MTVLVGLVGSQVSVDLLQSVDQPTVAGNLEQKSHVCLDGVEKITHATLCLLCIDKGNTKELLVETVHQPMR